MKQPSRIQKSKVTRDRKLTILVAAMVKKMCDHCKYKINEFQMFSYLVCWFPYACTSIAETAGYKPESIISFYILAIPTMLAKMSVCIDPIIYFWLNPQVPPY